jgi:hypothetical protein
VIRGPIAQHSLQHADRRWRIRLAGCASQTDRQQMRFELNETTYYR